MHDIPLSAWATSDTQYTSVRTTGIHWLEDFPEYNSRPGVVETASPLSPSNAIATFYAHALTAGADAIEACDEFSELFETRGEEIIAVLFRDLAVVEMKRTSELARRTAGLPLPRLPRWQYNWLYSAPPDQSVREIIAHLMTPHLALNIALDAECHVKRLYERISSTTSDAEVRAQALELATEKSRQVQWLRDALTTVFPPFVWQEDLDDLWPL